MGKLIDFAIWHTCEYGEVKGNINSIFGKARRE